jgi:tuberculosinol/isotuberculosinol synthase
MNTEEFISLSNDAIEEIVKRVGPTVCTCPINGTRRWFTLEHANTDYENVAAGYLDTVAQAYVDLFKLFFDHGISYLLVPSFGPDLLERGEEYLQLAVEGFSRLTYHPLFLDFYAEYHVQVHFYGDYERYFSETEYAQLIEQFDALTRQTSGHNNHYLFFGLFAHDASETVARFAIDFYKQNKRVPNRSEIVQAYYGVDLPPVDIFIGFDKFSSFDMPLVATGMEDLYFTVSPTLYMTQNQLRAVLYDHIYSRRNEIDYSEMSPESWQHMRHFYRKNHGNTLGVGTKVNGIWYPLPQVQSDQEE